MDQQKSMKGFDYYSLSLSNLPPMQGQLMLVVLDEVDEILLHFLV